MFKALQEYGKSALLDVINHWWATEEKPQDMTVANIASIYKKGDPSVQENYRPISLLKTAYKIFTHILKNRIEDAIDHHLQLTQYGFRKGRSTSNAIHIIRGIM